MPETHWSEIKKMAENGELLHASQVTLEEYRRHLAVTIYQGDPLIQPVRTLIQVLIDRNHADARLKESIENSSRIGKESREHADALYEKARAFTLERDKESSAKTEALHTQAITHSSHLHGKAMLVSKWALFLAAVALVVAIVELCFPKNTPAPANQSEKSSKSTPKGTSQPPDLSELPPTSASPKNATSATPLSETNKQGTNELSVP